MHAAIQATAATDEQEFPIGLEDRAVGEIQSHRPVARRRMQRDSAVAISGIEQAVARLGRSGTGASAAQGQRHESDPHR